MNADSFLEEDDLRIRCLKTFSATHAFRLRHTEWAGKVNVCFFFFFPGKKFTGSP